MKEEFIVEGFWQLPDKPDNKVFGKLKFVPGNSLELELQGALNSPLESGHSHSLDFIDPPLILGVETKGKEVTLYKCRQMGHSQIISAGLHITKFIVEAVFLGAHFESEDKVNFGMVSIGFSNLDEWANRHPITSEYLENDWKRLVVKYEHPTSISANIENYKIRLAFYGPIESNHKNQKITISYETKVEIISHEPRPLEDYLTLIRRIQNFFGLAMGAPTFPIAIEGISDVNKSIMENGETFQMPIEIYYLAGWWPDEIKENHYFQMMFTLSTVETSFETYIRNWMEKFDLLEPTINLYFSVLYNPHSYAEVKFLSLAQALETYHRRVYGGRYQDDEEYSSGLYEKLMNVIPSDLSKGFKDSLKGRLKYANEFSLRTRLKKIIESVSAELDFDFVKSKKDMEFFILKVVATRNYWTHYSSELADEAVKTSRERLVLITRMQLLLEVCLLKELGFDSVTIRELIQRSDRFRLLKQM